MKPNPEMDPTHAKRPGARRPEPIDTDAYPPAHRSTKAAGATMNDNRATTMYTPTYLSTRIRLAELANTDDANWDAYGNPGCPVEVVWSDEANVLSVHGNAGELGHWTSITDARDAAAALLQSALNAQGSSLDAYDVIPPEGFGLVSWIAKVHGSVPTDDLSKWADAQARCNAEHQPPQVQA